METIGFIGLGRMGAAMATNLLKAGYRLRVYNRTPQKMEPLVAQGAEAVAHPFEVAEPGGIVITMLTNDAALDEVVFGAQGLQDRLGKDGVHLSMSTISPQTSRRLAEHHRRHGGFYVAAPVFGRPDAAAAARLWIVLSGPAEAKRRVQPVLQAMGQGLFDFGEDPEAANIVKLAGNMLIGAAIEAMAEAYTLAERNGIPREAIHEMLSSTLFACPVYQNYGRMIARQTYEPVGATASLIRKDMELVLQTAWASLVPMPVADLVHNRLTARVARGRGEADWAELALEVSEGRS
ncbi:MAG TPA: NAD(P)-dependent oxidoreductase [Chthonomonas sp.]|uniref:NAD(P)-dependent oxidoreductase n=1 Tax=Chthonomonas sp. TaxID=2282153 RepID=UPI002B4ABC3D|nr:NAD(P)-dependent oxidoreductase [Chthonomonas sp.]HLI49488.1 NAD(P)-dependent oxidoreductase [Chthonomonas sp.]